MKNTSRIGIQISEYAYKLLRDVRNRSVEYNIFLGQLASQAIIEKYSPVVSVEEKRQSLIQTASAVQS